MSDLKCIPKEHFKNYPLLARLLELHTVPKEIHLLGTLPEITLDEYGRATPRILTIVGSRKNTTYGKQVLEMLLASLKNQNVLIVSGLALGIDGLAHKNALRNNLKTIAIPGSGLNEKVLYPSAHKNLAKEILASDGLLISEFPLDTQAAPWTFPMRNRIMAALSDAVLIVEAEEKSGTLITARQSLELGRDIGAIPGDIFSPTAQGTNMLIREGAYAITSSQNLFDLLHLLEEKTQVLTQEKKYSEYESIIMKTLREPLDKDTLFTSTKLSFENFITAFSSLELQGHIKETFGEVRRIV